jgi:hypothetical protein
VPGANLSMGDMHFSQGDGEVSFSGAIEISGFLELKVSVIKGGMTMLPEVGPSPLCVNPIFEVRFTHRALTPAPRSPSALCTCHSWPRKELAPLNLPRLREEPLRPIRDKQQLSRTRDAAIC